MRASVDTVYAIGSITKTFTAAAVLALADDGKLSLDDPLGRFVPAFPEPGRSATVRQLLSHTSGIRSVTSLGPRYWAQAGREIEPADLVAIFANEPPDFPPGTAYRYSNSGYILLGLVVEKAVRDALGRATWRSGSSFRSASRGRATGRAPASCRDGRAARRARRGEASRTRGTSASRRATPPGRSSPTAGDVAAWIRRLSVRAARERRFRPRDGDADGAAGRQGPSPTATASASTPSRAGGASSTAAACRASTRGRPTFPATTSRSRSCATRTATSRWRSPTRWRVSFSACRTRRPNVPSADTEDRPASGRQRRTRFAKATNSASLRSDTAA